MAVNDEGTGQIVMRLRDLASQTDAHEFQRLYHDPRVHTSEVASKFGILPNRVSEFAHLLGVPTRRAVGVAWKPTLLRVKADKPKPQKLGPCNPQCPLWQTCKGGRLWLGMLPCEKELDWEKDIEYEADSLATLGRMPIEARVSVEAMG